MEPQRLTGPGAGPEKYDILTALSVVGLNGTPTMQMSMMRLIALITARYNWSANEFSVGQRDMARMWSVNERTVKREMKRLTEAGILICTRPGVRGRVGAYQLNMAMIAELSADCWRLVGPDFEHRMTERHRAPDVKVVAMKDYRSALPPPEINNEGPWGRVLTVLARENGAMFESWFSRLTFNGYSGGTLLLVAPSPFIQRYVETHLLGRLLNAAEEEFGPIDRVQFSA